MTIFAQVSSTFTPDIVSRLARNVDEPVEKTQRAVDALICTMMGGLLKRTSNDIGIGQLFSQLKKGQFNGQIAGELPVILNDPARTNTLISRGDEAVNHLLPAMKSSIGNMISSYAGIRNSSAIALLGLTSAVTLDELARQTVDKKVDAVGLAMFIQEQRDAFLAAVPDALMPRLVEKVGLHQIVTEAANGSGRRPAPPTSAPARQTDAPAFESLVRQPVSFTSDAEPGGSSSWLRWVGGLFLLVLLAGAGFVIWQKNQAKTAQATETTGSAESDSIGTNAVARSLDVPADTTAGATAPPADTAATTAPVASTGLSVKMTAYLAEPTTLKGRVFPLAGVAFFPGSTTLTPGSEASITELLTVLKTHPTTQIQLIGYANDGSAELPNKLLSAKRVNVIKQQLVTAGINFIRVDAIGLGTGIPPRKPGDSTAVRRPSLRKIDFKVIQK